MTTDVVTPELFEEIVMEVIERAKEDDAYFIIGDFTGDISLGESSADGAVAIETEISFADEAFKGDEGDIRPLMKANTFFNKVIVTESDLLSEKALEEVIEDAE